MANLEERFIMFTFKCSHQIHAPKGGDIFKTDHNVYNIGTTELNYCTDKNYVFSYPRTYRILIDRSQMDAWFPQSYK